MTKNDQTSLRGFVRNRQGSNKELANDVAKLQQKTATDLDNAARAQRVARTLREATE